MSSVRYAVVTTGVIQMVRINYDRNWYDVMRQVIAIADNGKYKCQSSVNKDGQQYWIVAEYTIKELHYEHENDFKPMRGDTD